mmetsp:Transcript_11065/g.34589  ORF Transcript_11065/g.34589 Transcript_11065/m.34589 type:complete len:339 (+) Transcript_11065:646-1662(+)
MPDSVQAVGDRHDSAVGKGLPRDSLHLLVRLHVNARRGLVHQDNSRELEQRAAEGQQLALAGGEGAAAASGHVQGDPRPEAGRAQGGPKLLVAALAEGVQVVAHGPAHDKGLLWDHGDGGAQCVDAKASNVDAVNEHPARLAVNEAEEHARDGALARARAPDDAELFAARHLEVQAVQGARQPWPVAQRHGLEAHGAEGGPRARVWVLRPAPRRLLGHPGELVLQEPFQRGQVREQAHDDAHGAHGEEAPEGRVREVHGHEARALAEGLGIPECQEARRRQHKYVHEVAPGLGHWRREHRDVAQECPPIHAALMPRQEESAAAEDARQRGATLHFTKV